MSALRLGVRVGRPRPQTAPSRSHTLAYAAAIFSAFGWASLYASAKVALRDVTPLMIALDRAALACLVLGGIVCIRAGGLRAGLALLRREAVEGGWRLCLLGVASLAGTSILAMTAQGLLPASVNGLLNNLGPFWIALFAAGTGRARSPTLMLAGSVLAVAGVALVLGVEQPPALPAVAAGVAASPIPSASPRLVLGAAISLAGSLLIATQTFVARRVMAGRDPLAATTVAAAWGALPMFVAVALGVGGSLPGYLAAPGSAKLLLVWLGTACTAFNFSLWYYALAHLPVTRIANFQYLIPPLSVAIAILVLGEPASPGLFAGALAIVGGIAVAQRGTEPA
jgi:drug/metabolite transporter (DMT)-like permease